MKIIDKYLIRNFLVPFTYCMLTFILLYIIRDLIVNLEEFIQSGTLSFTKIIYSYLLMLPLIIVRVSPIASLLAVIYSMGNLSKHNEISAMRTSGISIYRILVPYILVGSFITFFTFLINEQFASGANLLAMQEFNKKSETSGQDNILKDLILMDKEKNLYNIKTFEINSSKIEQVEIKYYYPDKKILKKRIYAKKGIIEGNKWILYDGKTENFTREGDLNREDPGGKFSKQIFSTATTKEDLIKSKLSNVFLSFNTDKHQRTSLPFINIVVIFLAVPFTLKITGRGGAIFGVALSIGIFFLYYIIYSASIAAGKEGFINPALSAWLPHIIFTVLGIGILSKTR